jgi:hypothetical protein
MHYITSCCRAEWKNVCHHITAKEKGRNLIKFNLHTKSSMSTQILEDLILNSRVEKAFQDFPRVSSTRLRLKEEIGETRNKHFFLLHPFVLHE